VLSAAVASSFPVVSPHPRTLQLPNWDAFTGMDASIIPATFASEFKQTFESAISNSTVLGMMYSNSTAKLAATYQSPTIEYGYNLTQADYQGAKTGYLDINSVCRDDAALVFENVFAAFPSCSATGQQKTFPFYNKTCDVYSASFPNPLMPGKKKQYFVLHR
jgi:hypothetical protein